MRRSIRFLGRNLFVLAIVILLINFTGHTALAQQKSQQITVDESLLTPDQLAQARAKSTVQTAGEWVGLGKEIGQAVDGSLSALTQRADEFAQTRVGVFTMVIVAYKVIGSDVIQFIIGAPLLLIFIGLGIWFFRKNCIVRSICIEASESGKPLKWQVYEPSDETLWGHFVAFIILLIIGFCVIFM